MHYFLGPGFLFPGTFRFASLLVPSRSTVFVGPGPTRSGLGYATDSNQHEDSDILTIDDSSEDGEWGETGTSGRDVCPVSSSKSFLNYEI